MPKTTQKLLLLIFPFLIMILINESVRLTINEKPYKVKGVTAINSKLITKTKCSWHCYIDTGYCKHYHVKTLTHYFDYIDPIYFKIIRSMHSTGNYQLANVIFLVLLLPLLMFFLWVKIIDLQSQINSLKSKS